MAPQELVPTFGHVLLGDSGHFHEIHLGEAVEAHEGMNLALDILLNSQRQYSLAK